MTIGHHIPLPVSSLGSRAVLANFQGGQLTMNLGALRLREVAQRTGLFHALDAATPNSRPAEPMTVRILSGNR